MIDYNKTIDNVNSYLESYKEAVEKNNLGELERLKHLLTAEKALLRQLLITYTSLYKKAKRELLIKKEQAYKQYRHEKGYSQGDSKSEAKIDTIKELEETDNMFVRKEKCRGLIDDVNDVVISIATILKSAKSEVKYGY